MQTPHKHTIRSTCIYCGRVAILDPFIGWVHLNGLGAYWQRCPACNWEGSAIPPFTRCPHCHSLNLIDTHVVLPERSDADALLVSAQTSVEP
jgi:hypothetical protein